MESIITTVITIAGLIGGLVSLFAGRKFYPVWLGLASYFFMTRILDLGLVRLPADARNWVVVAVSLVIAVLVFFLSNRFVRIVPALGGFIVGTLIMERLLGAIFPESGKFVFFIMLIVGGLLGLFIFRKVLAFDTSVMALSAFWGASFFITPIFDFMDVFLLSLAGATGGQVNDILNFTLLVQFLAWLALAAIGFLVQRKIPFKPVPEVARKERQASEEAASPGKRRTWIIGGVVGAVVILLLVAFAGSNAKWARSMRNSVLNIERRLGLEAEAPGDAPWEWASTILRPQVELKENDRILVLVPHPDDDILSTAGTIQQAVEMGLPVKVVYMTNGDYNETSYAIYRKEITADPAEALRLGATRREEAIAAQGILGVKPEQITFLGYPDGGGLEIFEKHWGESEPYTALLSQQSEVPYTFAQTPFAPYKGENIVADIKKVVSDFQPTKIFTSHPGDVHPDHQTVPLYLQVALWELGQELDPDVFHFITHYGRWPLPRGYQPEHPLEPPAQFDVGNRWNILPITTEQQEKKLAALKAHVTQWGSGQAYLESLVRTNELFDVLYEIPLPTGKEVQILPAETAFFGEPLAIQPEGDQEKFIEAEIRTVRLEGDELVFAVELQQPLVGDTIAKVWTMGFKSDTPFGEMPKIYMVLSSKGARVYDQGKELPAESIKISGTPTRSEVRVPLSLLGNPEKLMISAQTNVGDIPLDNIPWVFLSLE
jgi:LmbE family N-acetylglucosaminyl deacetylase